MSRVNVGDSGGLIEAIKPRDFCERCPKIGDSMSNAENGERALGAVDWATLLSGVESRDPAQKEEEEKRRESLTLLKRDKSRINKMRFWKGKGIRRV